MRPEAPCSRRARQAVKPKSPAPPVTMAFPRTENRSAALAEGDASGMDDGLKGAVRGEVPELRLYAGIIRDVRSSRDIPVLLCRR